MKGNDKSRAALSTVALLTGFVLALALRIAVGGHNPAASVPAGLTFAACLTVMAVAAKTPLTFSARAALIGIAGGAALCTPAAIAFFLSRHHILPSAMGYLGWSLIVGAVAVTEELFLRGALFDSVNSWAEQNAAILITAMAFASLHIPLYGWHVVPLDLSVGIWLGVLRISGRAWSSPVIAHTLADLVAWWLR